MTELNWMQEYAASEAIELREEGQLTRREMMQRSLTAAGALLISDQIAFALPQGKAGRVVVIVTTRN